MKNAGKKKQATLVTELEDGYRRQTLDNFVVSRDKDWNIKDDRKFFNSE